ncbi:hypothetical protein HMPREF1552_02410 [Leptotrichia sp. oral taxon 879 str. F0557]|nr:hypothetical protein HMPREF1552_02410 [Leptotrichia sp. oral taxon 879 str. F0557]
MEETIMKKIIVLIVSAVLIVSCSYFEGADRQIRERGIECRYNKRGGVENCRLGEN